MVADAGAAGGSDPASASSLARLLSLITNVRIRFVCVGECYYSGLPYFAYVIEVTGDHMGWLGVRHFLARTSGLKKKFNTEINAVVDAAHHDTEWRDTRFESFDSAWLAAAEWLESNPFAKIDWRTAFGATRVWSGHA